MPYRQTLPCRVAALIAMPWVAGTVQAAGVAAEPASDTTRAAAPAAAAAYARCEDAVANAIRDMRGAAVEALHFEPGSRAVDTQGTRLAIRGSGRYQRGGRAPVAFRYSCAYDDATGTTSGVLFHETDATPPPALPVWHADLGSLAVDACESRAAEHLQAARPRASGIVFDGADRRLSPGVEGGTVLEGSGRVAAAAGAAPGAFRYRCEFDAAGRLRMAHAE